MIGYKRKSKIRATWRKWEVFFNYKPKETNLKAKTVSELSSNKQDRIFENPGELTRTPDSKNEDHLL